MKITFKIETLGVSACDLTFTPKHFTPEAAQKAILKAFNEVVSVDEATSPILYDVWMEGFNEMKKIHAIKAVRGVTGLGLKEAKDLVEGSFPRLLLPGVTATQIQNLARELNEGEVKWRYTSDPA